MRHLKKNKKLHRKRDQRKALKKVLVTNLILKGEIRTTKAKAKEAQRLIERLITISKKNDFVALRRIREILSPKVAKKLFYEIAPRYTQRKGGYTKILHTTYKRKNDAASLVILKFVE